MLHGLCPGIVGSGITPVDVVPVDTAINHSDLTTYSFSSVSFGTATADRQIYIVCTTGASGGATRTVSSATIGGETASVVVQTSTATGGKDVAIIKASVPSGTSGTVSITFSGACLRAAISVYAVYNANTTDHATASDVDEGPLSVSINVPANGAVIAGVGCGGNTSSYNLTSWTGVNEDVDTSVSSGDGGAGAGDDHFGSGHLEYAAAQTGLTVSVDDGFSTSNSIAVVSIAPA